MAALPLQPAQGSREGNSHSLRDAGCGAPCTGGRVEAAPGLIQQTPFGAEAQARFHSGQADFSWPNSEMPPCLADQLAGSFRKLSTSASTFGSKCPLSLATASTSHQVVR